MLTDLSPGCLSKIISGNCLAFQLSVLVVPFVANKRLTKKLKKRNWRMRCPYGALKTSDIFLRIQKPMCPEKTIEGHNLSPLTDLDALYKQRVKTIAQL